MNRAKTKVFQPIQTQLRRLLHAIDRQPVRSLLYIAPILNFLVEVLTRRSLVSVLSHMWESTAFFILNCMIVALTLLPTLFVRRRYFAWALGLSVWLGLGITNCVLTGYRTTPLSFTDLRTLASVWSIMSVYLKPFQIILIVVAFAAVIALLVLAFRKLPRSERNLKRATVTTLVSAVVFVALLFCGTRLNIIRDSVPNLAEAYQDYGFAWCFSLSAVDRGIDEPEGFSEKTVDEILESLADTHKHEQPSEGEPANLIFVQLESFFDPVWFKDLEFTRSPARVFHTLKNSEPSGLLTVPVVGAGTVNTEFEVLTGMSLDFFGTGEIPYNTVLREQTCESLPYILRELGYTSHAIHNNGATFYDRHLVYKNLGFDTFTALEYMNGVEYNALGWAKDGILIEQILAAMESTEGQDFVNAISVQAHGKYPKEELEGVDYELHVSGLEDESLIPAYEYYIQELRQTDEFVGKLVATLADYEEPVMLVFYGDHLPSLDIEPEMLKNGSLYQTEYVIWTNYEMVAYNKNLYAYQLSSHVLNLLGYENGILTKLHQSWLKGERSAEEYQESLEMLEYDMLYGDMAVYDGVTAPEPTELQMGVKPIRLSGTEQRGEVYFVYGENLTPWSEIYRNGEIVETLFVDEHTILWTEPPPEPGDELMVVQLADDGTELSRSEPITVGAAQPEE